MLWGVGLLKGFAKTWDLWFKWIKVSDRFRVSSFGASRFRVGLFGVLGLRVKGLHACS